MNVLVSLAVILFILMIFIGGKKGARSFWALFFNFGVLLIAVLIMANPNVDPIILTLIDVRSLVVLIFFILMK